MMPDAPAGLILGPAGAFSDRTMGYAVDRAVGTPQALRASSPFRGAQVHTAPLKGELACEA